MSKYRVKREPVVQPQDESIRLIPLTKGQVAIVDAADYEWLNQWNWCALKRSHGGGYYAVRTGYVAEGRKPIYMHYVLGFPNGDHENRNGIDNRRSNLRPATESQNMANRGLGRNNTSGYKGVVWDKNRQKWVAYIHFAGIQQNLGGYPTKDDAAKAYNKAAIEFYGEFAFLNQV